MPVMCKDSGGHIKPVHSPVFHTDPDIAGLITGNGFYGIVCQAAGNAVLMPVILKLPVMTTLPHPDQATGSP